MRGGARKVTIAVLLCALPLACSNHGRSRDDGSSGGETGGTMPADAALRIATWLDCDECTDAELAAVVELGAAAVPTLAATLRDGLSPAHRARLERQLREHHAKRVERGRALAGTGPSLGEDAYTTQQLDVWNSSYRARAATALGRIAGEPARRALRDALATKQRPSVEMAIRNALEGGVGGGR